MSDSNFINGKWLKASGKEFNSISPVDGQQIWQSQASTAEDVDFAVKAARDAFLPWAKLSFDERLTYIQKFVDIVSDRKEEMAIALSKDLGKPLWEARTEIASVANKFRISIEAYKDRCKETRASFSAANNSYTQLRHKPHGVLAVFGPYNFPVHTPNGHIMPALIAGNTVVFKPSELTPYASELMLRAWSDAGLPPGVINLLQGDAETGRALSAHKGLNGILFTGSSRVGKLLHQAYAGDTGKILALEMGGNNPLIVHQVNDFKAAAYNTIQSAFITSGQRCTCARRLILIESEEAKLFLEELVNQVSKITIGNPLQEDLFMGPVVSEKQAATIMQANVDLQKLGAKVIYPQEILPDMPSKAYISPGILEVTGIPGISDDEVFGPLLQVYIEKNWDAAIERANATEYGLSSALFSDDPNLYEDFFFRINAGLVNWNSPTTGASSAMPFGGIGKSGNHRPSAYYAADYSSYPVASIETPLLSLPQSPAPKP